MQIFLDFESESLIQNRAPWCVDKVSESRICSAQNFCCRNLLLSSQQSVKVRDTCSICHPPLCQTGGNYGGSGWWGVLKDWWPPSWSHHPVNSISHPAWLIGGFCQSSAGRKSGHHPVILIGAPLMTLHSSAAVSFQSLRLLLHLPLMCRTIFLNQYF